MSGLHDMSKAALVARVEALERRVAELEAGPGPAIEAFGDAAPFPVAIARADDARILYANAEFCSYFALADDPRRHAVTEFWPESRQREAAWQRLHPEGWRPGAERSYRRADGGEVWAVASSALIDYRAEAAVATVWLDVTARRRAETALRESERLLQVTIDNLPHFVFVKDRRGRYVVVNQNYADFYDTPREQLLMLTTPNTPHPDAVEKRMFMDEDRRVLELGETVERRGFLTVSQKGRQAFHDVVKLPLRDEDGSIIGLLAIAQDVTERRRSEDLNRANERLLRTVVDTIPQLLAAKSAQGRYILVNRAMAASYGLTAEQMLGRTTAELPGVSSRRLETVNREMHEVLSRGELVEFGHRELLLHDGTSRFLQPVGAPLVNDSGEPEGVVFIDQDVHEQILARRELERYRDSLEQLVAERTAALEAAQEELLRGERLATIGQITGTVAHELRNPLGTIQGSIDLLARIVDAEEPMAERALARLNRSVARCDRIIDELLGYSRVRRGARHVVALDGWLHGLLGEYERPESVSLSCALRSGVEVEVDGERLRQAFVNVLDNACQSLVEAGTVPGEIRVASRRQGPWALIEIADNGPGIPPESCERVFEPLYSTRSFGVGLGLPLVRTILEEHGGRVRMDGRRAQGVRVVLELPVEEAGPA